MSQPVCAVWWGPGGSLRIVDQRKLPGEFVERDLASVADAAEAIRTLAVRGAPAIGVAAAMALAVAARGGATIDQLREDAARLRATRPTAVNLAWALERMLARAAELSTSSGTALAEALRDEAEQIRAEDEAMCRAIGEHGAPLIEPGMRVLTHCNAGALATAGIGTALAPLYVAHGRGVPFEVFADETRPLLQGARLTAWELSRAGIPVTLCTDGMAASLMAAGRVDLVIVGADRIAANGDVANKIGTYGLAVLAHHHRIPFVVAAPSSTVDVATPTGDSITIEQRAAEEVTMLGGARVAPDGIAVHNPAFDVTPAALIKWIVTDRGLHHGPRIADVTSVELPPPA